MDENDIVRSALSYKDPDGYVVKLSNHVLRIITHEYKHHFAHFMSSGLYSHLSLTEKIIRHTEINNQVFKNAYKVIAPEEIPFINYPYEWCFDQLKDAAMLTLAIQQDAIQYGMTLKDASAYNVQYYHGKPIFIDTSSFEILDATKPWVAYGQFCRHFLAPLALMCYTDLRLQSLLKQYLDGIPLDLCKKLLPFKSRFNLGLLTHIHLHAAAINKSADGRYDSSRKSGGFSESKMKAIIAHLVSSIKALALPKQKTEWDDYYLCNNNYSARSMQQKEQWIDDTISKIKSNVQIAWDIGANDGRFSRLIAGHNIEVISIDIDANAVNSNYLINKAENIANVVPLCVDITNLSSSCGWALKERQSFSERSKPDLIIALAIIHHLCIGANLPLDMIADFFAAQTNKYLLMEFIDEDDGQILKLARNKESIVKEYSLSSFKKTFSRLFAFAKEYKIEESSRSLFLLEKLHT